MTLPPLPSAWERQRLICFSDIHFFGPCHGVRPCRAQSRITADQTTMPSRVSPSLRQYTQEELQALLQAIKDAIAAREAAAEERPAVRPAHLTSPEMAGEAPRIAPALPPADESARTPEPRSVAAAAAADAPVPGESATAGQPLPPPEVRYMHPSNRNMTWSGEGMRPEWIDAYLAQGGSWIALRNAAEKLAPRKR